MSLKASIAIIIAVCVARYSTAQDLNGFWKGNFTMLGCFPTNNIELQLTIKNGVVSGDSYHYQDVDNYVKKTFSGSYDPDQKKLVIQEGIVTTYHIPNKCVICVKQFDLVYSRAGNQEILRGLWSGNVINMNVSCGGDSIILTRVRESAFRDIPEIKVDTGTIRLDFYDNAIVDGDSITVLVDDKVVMAHKRLTSQPLTTYVRIDAANRFHEVAMLADNEGTIPPNTAVLIITAGERRYQLYLSSTGSRSARVRFLYEGGESTERPPPANRSL